MLAWLEDNVEGAEVSMDHVGVSVCSSHVNQYLVIDSLCVWQFWVMIQFCTFYHAHNQYVAVLFDGFWYSYALWI